MNDIDKITAIQTVSREMAEADPYAMEYLTKELKYMVAKKLLEEVAEGETYVITLMPQETRDNPFLNNIDVRRRLNIRTLVNCAECKYNPRTPRNWADNDPVAGYEWCREFVRVGGFCPYGKRL